MSEVLGPEEIIEQYPDITDNKLDTIIEGVPALKFIIKGLYEELILNNPDSQIWRNAIARHPIYSAHARQATILFQKIFKETNFYVALRTGKYEPGQEPPCYAKFSKDPMGWIEECASLEEEMEYPVTDSRGEYIEIQNGWVHLTAVGQAIHQNGDLVLLNKDHLGQATA